MVEPAIKKRGGDPDVKPKPPRDKSADQLERELEEGLEESMAGSDPVSITQPTHHKAKPDPIGRKSTSDSDDPADAAAKRP